MDRRGNRPGVAARCAVVAALALGTVACAEQPTPRASETTAASPEVSDEAAAIAAAEATVRAYFAVKGRAEEPFSVRVDQQAAFLTSRDVHPAAEYAASQGDLPSGITDQETSVELPSSRVVGDEVLVDFAFDAEALAYTLVNDVLQPDSGQPGTGYWTGTATLEERDGVWLINQFTTETSGGGTTTR